MAKGKPRTWADIDAFIARYDLPYSVMRFNMSLRGVLVDVTGAAVAHNVKDASMYLYCRNGGGERW